MKRYGEQLKNSEYSLDVHVDDVSKIEYVCNITLNSTYIPYISVGLIPPINKQFQKRYVPQLYEAILVDSCGIPTSDTHVTETLELQQTIFSAIDDGKFKYVSKHTAFDGVRRFTVFALDKTKLYPHIDEQMEKSLELITDLYENGWIRS